MSSNYNNMSSNMSSDYNDMLIFNATIQRKYTNEDIVLLADYDNLANYPNGTSLQASFKRMYENFHDDNFKRLSGISLGHIYNLRKTNIYRHKTLKYKNTKSSSKVSIGLYQS